jgi:hypothetical protein
MRPALQSYQPGRYQDLTMRVGLRRAAPGSAATREILLLRTYPMALCFQSCYLTFPRSPTNLKNFKYLSNLWGIGGIVLIPRSSRDEGTAGFGLAALRTIATAPAQDRNGKPRVDAAEQ